MTKLEFVVVHWIGVDTSESTVVAALVGEEEKQEQKWEFENSRSARRAWLREVSALGDVNLVLEATESFSYRLAMEAKEAGLGVHVVSTTGLKYFRKSEGYEDKRDDLDAWLLGLMGYRGLRSVRPAVERTDREEELRGLDRLREQLVGLRVVLGQKLRSAVVELSPGVGSGRWGGPKVTSATFLAVLARWPDLTTLCRSRLQTVTRLVQKAGRCGSERAEEIAQELRSWSRGVQDVPEVRRAMIATELSMLRENLELVQRQIKELELRLRAAVQAHPRGPDLLQVPSVGNVVAARLIAEALPRARTASEGQLATYSGLTPASRDSGKTRRSRLRSFVNKRLASIHFESAVGSLRVSPIDRAYYDKKMNDFRGHKAAHTKATIALARQRHKVIYKVLLGDSYDELKVTRSTLERHRRKAAA